MSFYNFAKDLVHVFIFPFFKIESVFEEDLNDEKGFILASNHTSDLDPPLLGITLRRKIRFMAKSELFEIPVLGFIIKKLDAFPVARGKGDHKAIENAVDVVNEGGILGIFPEGGRSKDGKLKKAKSGAAIIAGQTGADIVPACIIFGKRNFLRRQVIVKYGKRIKSSELGVTGMNKAELRAANQLLTQRIADLLGVEAP